MSEIMPPGAGTGTGTIDDQALAALRYGWGDAYEIGRDDKRGWHARRRDGRGGDITAADPDALWQAVTDDYNLRPVPRDCTAPAAP